MTEVATRYAHSTLPTPYGDLDLYVFRDSADGKEHAAIVYGDVAGPAPVLARVHSSCLTGEVFHSLRCDCRAQFDAALEQIAAAGRGVLIYLLQEGRGIGLGNKVRAYALQDAGRDTVDANVELGFSADERSYRLAAQMLMDLDVTRVKLMTNNPSKVAGLKDAGIDVVERVALWVGENETNEAYLATKRLRMGHTQNEENNE